MSENFKIIRNLVVTVNYAVVTPIAITSIIIFGFLDLLEFNYTQDFRIISTISLCSISPILFGRKTFRIVFMSMTNFFLMGAITTGEKEYKKRKYLRFYCEIRQNILYEKLDILIRFMVYLIYFIFLVVTLVMKENEIGNPILFENVIKAFAIFLSFDRLYNYKNKLQE